MSNANDLQREALMDRYGLKVAAHLDDQPLPHDISERLRVARVQALAQRKRESVVQAEAAPSIFASGSSAVLGSGGGFGWLGGLAGALPIVALAVGLIVAHGVVNEERAQELAQVDVQILTDDLPPAAFADPGFAQFLKFGSPATNASQE